MPNYDEESVESINSQLQKMGLHPAVMIDASHGNSMKDYKNQKIVIRSVADQLKKNTQTIMGIMIESNLKEGKQSHTPGKDNPSNLQYGVSITDGCIGVEETDILLGNINEAVPTKNKPLWKSRWDEAILPHEV